MAAQAICILKKEALIFFNSAQAWIVFGAYTLISMFCTFFIGGFFSLNNSDLFSFFYFQSFAFIFLIPAITMRLWADERKSGTLEFLLTQPLKISAIVLGKFLSAWSICIMMLMFSLPLWIMTMIYFEVDNLNIFTAYLGCVLVSGAFCALGCLISSFCSSSAVSYLAGLLLFIFVCFGHISKLVAWFNLPKNLEIRVQNIFHFDKHFNDLISGQISIDNILYFALIIILSLWLNTISVDFKKN